jgi:hypothetical protein
MIIDPNTIDLLPGEPLPTKYFNRLPEYLKLFSHPVITENRTVDFNLELNDDFYLAFTRHYRMLEKPTPAQLCEMLEAELKHALAGLF